MGIQEAQKHTDPTDPNSDTDADPEHWLQHAGNSSGPSKAGPNAFLPMKLNM